MGLPLAGLVLAGCATVHLDATPPVQSYYAAPGAHSPVSDRQDGRIRIVTLNIAHGRGESFHQLLQHPATTLANLDSIATLLKDSGAQVVALQEADGPSFWSGNFNHIDYLAHNGVFSRSIHGVHAHGLGVSYGTALIANLDLRNTQAITFDPAVSPIPKGFVVSTASWPGNPDVEVDIVSLHLDFASESTRRLQANELIETLQRRQRPLIVTGDFNNGWQENSTVAYICHALGLSAFHPEASGLETFPAFGKRFDWILVSPEISYRSYRVIPDSVSDHRGVMAELELVRNMTTRIARLE